MLRILLKLKYPFSMQPLSLSPSFIHQGKAKILTKYFTCSSTSPNLLTQHPVFYNPIQTFNRDLTLLVLHHYIFSLKQSTPSFSGVRIIDALSASGLRTIRFLQQLPDIKQIYANDISPDSLKLMQENFQLNSLDMTKIKMTQEDANDVIRGSKKRNYPFDIIDIDPYGSAVPFLDSSVDAIKSGGLLAITCTDTRVLCGPDWHKCYYYYGSTRGKVHCFQENALRIVLNTVNSAANKHCKYIEPMLSFQTEFYLRAFVRVWKDKGECVNTGEKVGMVYNCNACGNYEYQSMLGKRGGKEGVKPERLLVSGPNCSVCQSPYYMNGPIWLGPLNNLQFVQKMYSSLSPSPPPSLSLKTHKQISGMLHAILTQKQLSLIPLGINLSLLSSNIKVSVPPKKLLFGVIQSLGYRMINSYIHQGLYKTSISISIIYQILKEWKKKENGEESMKKNVKEEFALRILEKKWGEELKVDWEYELKEVIEHVPQFFPHQEKGMGPKGQAKRKIIEVQQKGAQEEEHKIEEQKKQLQDEEFDQLQQMEKIDLESPK